MKAAERLNRLSSAFIDRALRKFLGVSSIRSNLSLREMKRFSGLPVQSV